MITRLLWLGLIAKSIAIDCHFSIGSWKYDLSQLAGRHEVTQETSTPPTITKTSYNVSLCGPLDLTNPSEDECPAGTFVCQKTISSRAGLDDRLLFVVPIAGEIGQGALNPAALSEQQIDPQMNWNFSLEGGMYNSVAQKVQIAMKCDANAKDTQPTFVAHDTKEAVLKLEWTSLTACPTNLNDAPPVLPSPPSGGFFSWLFLLSFFSISIYLVAGSYYNYSQYGLTGFQAIPHREVWQDAPYVVQDLFKSRGGGSRNGYSSLG